LVSGAISFFIGRVDVPVGPLLIVYLVTWILETIGQLFFWGLPGPALFGFVGMGLMTVWAIQKSVILRRKESRKL
jgi:putative membrane protein